MAWTLLGAGLLFGSPDGPTLKLPEQFSAKPGRIAQLRADSGGRTVRWLTVAEDVDLLPLPPDGQVALFCSPKPGRFVVFAYTAEGDIPSLAVRTLVVVGEEEPDGPTDELAADLDRLFRADRNEDKAESARKLAATYRKAALFALEPAVRTAGELSSRLRQAVQQEIPAEALPALRRRLADELVNQLPTIPNHLLTQSDRQAAERLFLRIARLLEAL